MRTAMLHLYAAKRSRINVHSYLRYSQAFAKERRRHVFIALWKATPAERKLYEEHVAYEEARPGRNHRANGGQRQGCFAVFHQFRPDEEAHPARERGFHGIHAGRTGERRQRTQYQQAGGHQDLDSPGIRPAPDGQSFSPQAKTILILKPSWAGPLPETKSATSRKWPVVSPPSSSFSPPSTPTTKQSSSTPFPGPQVLDPFVVIDVLKFFVDSDGNHVVICCLILRHQSGHSRLHSRHCAARVFSFTSFTPFASLTSSKSFTIRTYKKFSCNLFRIRTYKNPGGTPFQRRFLFLASRPPRRGSSRRKAVLRRETPNPNHPPLAASVLPFSRRTQSSLAPAG